MPLDRARVRPRRRPPEPDAYRDGRLLDGRAPHRVSFSGDHLRVSALLPLLRARRQADPGGRRRPGRVHQPDGGRGAAGDVRGGPCRGGSRPRAVDGERRPHAAEARLLLGCGGLEGFLLCSGPVEEQVRQKRLDSGRQVAGAGADLLRVQAPSGPVPATFLGLSPRLSWTVAGAGPRALSPRLALMLALLAPLVAVACGTTTSPPPEPPRGDLEGARYERMRVLSGRLVNRLQATRDELRTTRNREADTPLFGELLDQARRLRDRLENLSDPPRYVRADVSEIDRLATVRGRHPNGFRLHPRGGKLDGRAGTDQPDAERRLRRLHGRPSSGRCRRALSAVSDQSALRRQLAGRTGSVGRCSR